MPRPIVAIVGNAVYLLPPAEGPVQQAEHARRLVHAFGVAAASHNRAAADKARALVPHGVFMLHRSEPTKRDFGGTVEAALAHAVAWVAALNADLVTLDPSEVA